MPLSDRTTGRLIMGIPLALLAGLTVCTIVLFLGRQPVPVQLFGCWRSDSALLAIEPPASITFYRQKPRSQSHTGGWIQRADLGAILARILVFPMRFTVQEEPWTDSTGDHLVLDSIYYTRESFQGPDSSCPSYLF